MTATSIEQHNFITKYTRRKQRHKRVPVFINEAAGQMFRHDTKRTATFRRFSRVQPSRVDNRPRDL